MLTRSKTCAKIEVRKLNRGRKEQPMAKLNKYQSAVSTVQKMLGVEKVSWSRATKVCKQAMEDGFTLDDFITATENMMAGDKKYWSLYSVFNKTDYWLAAKKEPQTLKGVW